MPVAIGGTRCVFLLTFFRESGARTHLPGGDWTCVSPSCPIRCGWRGQTGLGRTHRADHARLSANALSSKPNKNSQWLSEQVVCTGHYAPICLPFLTRLVPRILSTAPIFRQEWKSWVFRVEEPMIWYLFWTWQLKKIVSNIFSFVDDEIDRFSPNSPYFKLRLCLFSPFS